MTAPRDLMEAAANAALAAYLETTGQRHDTIAERAFRHHILRAFERAVYGHDQAQIMRKAREQLDKRVSA